MTNMKQFTFTRDMIAFQGITVIVKDEGRQILTFWDLDDDMDDDVVELSYDDIDWNDSNYKEFYEQMEDQGFPWDDEKYLPE